MSSGAADYVRHIYDAASDATRIAPEHTEEFLARLETKLRELGFNVDLTKFVDVASQVVDLLRVMRADALLTLLRQYADTGSISLEEVDMDQLQREANSVLQPHTLEKFFSFTSSRDFVEGGKRSNTRVSSDNGHLRVACSPDMHALFSLSG